MLYFWKRGMIMKINSNEININDAVNFSNFDNLILKRRDNNFLLSDYQVSVLNRVGIVFNKYSNIRDLLFDIEECLNEFYDDELDLVSNQLAEFIYYSDTNK